MRRDRNFSSDYYARLADIMKDYSSSLDRPRARMRLNGLKQLVVHKPLPQKEKARAISRLSLLKKLF